MTNYPGPSSELQREAETAERNERRLAEYTEKREELLRWAASGFVFTYRLYLR